MIKHGKIHPIIAERIPHSHLDPIKEFITKGIADARETVVLQPQACDVRGAKRHNGQQCVIAKALQRVHKPQAVAVGRSLAYVVFNGLAIRFKMPDASRKVIEEFDSRGRVRVAPIELRVVEPSWRLRAKRVPRVKTGRKTQTRARTKRLGVRAIGGGVSAR